MNFRFIVHAGDFRNKIKTKTKTKTKTKNKNKTDVDFFLLRESVKATKKKLEKKKNGKYPSIDRVRRRKNME